MFRYFNVAGADPDGEIGECHEPETHLIPLAIRAARGLRDPLTINGTDYPTTDGTCVRDYVHVEDLVAAHLLGLDWLEEEKPSRVFNLGGGRGYSVREVLKAVDTVLGTQTPSTTGHRRAGDCASLVSGSACATRELGWKPQYAGLSETIRHAWIWERKNAPDSKIGGEQ